MNSEEIVPLMWAVTPFPLEVPVLLVLALSTTSSGSGVVAEDTVERCGRT